MQILFKEHQETKMSFQQSFERPTGKLKNHYQFAVRLSIEDTEVKECFVSNNNYSLLLEQIEKNLYRKLIFKLKKEDIPVYVLQNELGIKKREKVLRIMKNNKTKTINTTIEVKQFSLF